jgi:hypothetical protein
LQLARDHRVQVILVAMPVQAPYLLDPQIVTVAQAAGATLVDCRAVPGLGQERYEDSMHMNAAAPLGQPSSLRLWRGNSPNGPTRGLRP